MVLPCALHALSSGSGARFFLKTVAVPGYKMAVSFFRFLSSEGIAECGRACNKEKPSLQELSRAALNVSTHRMKCVPQSC